MPILLYGPRKSGTTLFQRLLDGEDSLFVLPSETKIKKYLAYLQSEGQDAVIHTSQLSDSELKSFFRSERKGWEAFDGAAYYNTIQTAKDAVRSLKDYISLDVKASASGFKRTLNARTDWAIKEVSGNTEKILHSFKSAFPDGKIILIYRDPRFVARAVYREKKRTGTTVNFKRTLEIAKEPYIIYQALEKYASDENVLSVHYENYTEHSEQAMRRVASFLNVPFKNTLTKPTINGELCVVPSASQKTARVFQTRQRIFSDISLMQYLAIRYYSFKYRSTVNEVDQDRLRTGNGQSS